MLLNKNTDMRDSSSCTLYYNEQERWLEAIWQGVVDPDEARRGAEAYLVHAADKPCKYLLNDNYQLRGPWFESLDWLADVWVPQATRLGLRYIAHITQADQHYDIFTLRLPQNLPFDLQIFQSQQDARDWLRRTRRLEERK